MAALDTYALDKEKPAHLRMEMGGLFRTFRL